MQAIASTTAVRPQFAGAKKSFAAKKVRARAAERPSGKDVSRHPRRGRCANPDRPANGFTDASDPDPPDANAGCRRQARRPRQG